MANLPSVEKRNRQSIKRRARNHLRPVVHHQVRGLHQTLIGAQEACGQLMVQPPPDDRPGIVRPRRSRAIGLAGRQDDGGHVLQQGSDPINLVRRGREQIVEFRDLGLPSRGPQVDLPAMGVGVQGRAYQQFRIVRRRPGLRCQFQAPQGAPFDTVEAPRVRTEHGLQALGLVLDRAVDEDQAHDVLGPPGRKQPRKPNLSK